MVVVSPASTASNKYQLLQLPLPSRETLPTPSPVIIYASILPKTSLHLLTLSSEDLPPDCKDTLPIKGCTYLLNLYMKKLLSTQTHKAIRTRMENNITLIFVACLTTRGTKINVAILNIIKNIPAAEKVKTHAKIIQKVKKYLAPLFRAGHWNIRQIAIGPKTLR